MWSDLPGITVDIEIFLICDPHRPTDRQNAELKVIIKGVLDDLIYLFVNTTAIYNDVTSGGVQSGVGGRLTSPERGE